MHEVAAGWLMTTLTSDPVMISLVQTAMTLPMFLLALPAGAFADVVDRRIYLLFTQMWMTLAAGLLAYCTYAKITNPALLVVMTFVLGIGTAFNSPAWHSVTPEIVARRNLPAAVSLNGMAINGAKAIGPALGGLILLHLSPWVAFSINSLSFLGTVWILLLWKRKYRPQNAPGERFLSAMRVGFQHAQHSPWLRVLIVRVVAFISLSSSLWALLPTLVKNQYQMGPSCYGCMMGLFGTGAVVGGTQVLPRLRTHLRMNSIVAAAWLLFSLGLIGVANGSRWPIYLNGSPLAWLAGSSMFLLGACWLCLLASFHLNVQSGAPDWARARVMSVYIWAFFGAATFGSTAWGIFARWQGTQFTLEFSAFILSISLLLTHQLRLEQRDTSKLTPSGHWEDPDEAAPVPADHGPILVTVEYRINLEDAPAFRDALAKLKVFRMQNGVLRWGIFVDLGQPEIYREVYLEESWAAHLRHHERVTEQEEEVARLAYAYHRGDKPPIVTHLAFCDGSFPDNNFDMTLIFQRSWGLGIS